MLAKINPLNLGIAAEFLGRSRPKNRSIVDDISAVSDLQGFSDIVIGHKNPDLLRFQVINNFLNLDHRDRINSRKRLVKKYEFGRNNQRSSDFHAPALSSRECIRKALSDVSNSEFVQQCFKPLPPFSAGERQSLEN